MALFFGVCFFLYYRLQSSCFHLYPKSSRCCFFWSLFLTVFWLVNTKLKVVEMSRNDSRELQILTAVLLFVARLFWIYHLFVSNRILYSSLFQLIDFAVLLLMSEKKKEYSRPRRKWKFRKASNNLRWFQLKWWAWSWSVLQGFDITGENLHHSER